MASTFPGAIDTDATLYVAADNIQTVLNVVQNPADTVAIVASTTGWVANMILTVDVEQQLVTGVVGANTLQVTRNINGTGAVLHAAGAKVSNLVNAAYHMALSSAVKAIEGTMTGANKWPAPGYTLKDSAGLYTWTFNDTANGVGVSSFFGPWITAATPGQGDGVGEYHNYVHDAGNAGVGAIGKSASFQCYKNKGSGGTLSGIWCDVTTNGSWTAQPPSAAVTNGPIGGTFSANLAHSTGKGGFACGANIYATCSGPSAGQQISGMEIDVSNLVAGTDGHAGIAVIDQSTHPTTGAGGDYGFGLSGLGSAPGFLYGLMFDVQGVATNGTLFIARDLSVTNGIDFAGVTFSGNILNLPGFVLQPGGMINSPLTINAGAPTAPSLAITSSVKTTAQFISFVHNTSAYTGNGLAMNFASGSGTFTGDFILCLNNNVAQFWVGSNGAVNSGPQNYLPSTGGAANAITVTLPVPLVAGLMLTIKLSSSLQAGANTLNGSNIRSSRNPANNIATAYAAGGIIRLVWDGAEYLDLSQ